MKNCSEIRESISLYIDDGLSADERRRFEEHIASCQDCRREYDELMQIIGLCRDMQEVELPGDFRDELHRKLLDAAAGGAKDKILRRAGYVKILSSIAAGLILIFLVTGIYKYGFTPQLRSGNSAADAALTGGAAAEPTRAAAMAGTEAAPKGEAKAESSVSAFGYSGASETAKVDSDGGDYNLASKKATEQPSTQAASEVDRSASAQNRTVQVPAVSFATLNEAANSSTASLTVTADDPAAQAENVKAIAVQNGGEEQQDADEKIKAAGTTDRTEPGEDIVLTFSIPNKQYESFTRSLDSGLGQENVQLDGQVSEDRTSTLNSLITRSNELDTDIKKLEEADSKANADKINGLKAELQAVQDDIENIRQNTDFTIVTITIKKK